MPLQAVIFDMDGVLTDTVEFHYLSWKKVVSQYGVPFTRLENEKLLGLTRRRSLEVLLGERSFSEQQIQAILQRKNEYFLEFVSQMNPAHLLPGVNRLLSELSTARMRIGVASASRNTRLVLKQLGVYNFMHAILDGNSMLPSKPAPDIFLAAASALQVQPQACLVLEDSASGIQAALAAGMCVVGLGPVRRVSQAHAVFSDLTEVCLKELRSVYNRFHQPGNKSDRSIGALTSTSPR